MHNYDSLLNELLGKSDTETRQIAERELNNVDRLFHNPAYYDGGLQTHPRLRKVAAFFKNLTPSQVHIIAAQWKKPLVNIISDARNFYEGVCQCEPLPRPATDSDSLDDYSLGSDEVLEKFITSFKPILSELAFNEQNNYLELHLLFQIYGYPEQLMRYNSQIYANFRDECSMMIISNEPGIGSSTWSYSDFRMLLGVLNAHDRGSLLTSLLNNPQKRDMVAEFIRTQIDDGDDFDFYLSGSHPELNMFVSYIVLPPINNEAVKTAAESYNKFVKGAKLDSSFQAHDTNDQLSQVAHTTAPAELKTDLIEVFNNLLHPRGGILSSHIRREHKVVAESLVSSLNNAQSFADIFKELAKAYLTAKSEGGDSLTATSFARRVNFARCLTEQTMQTLAPASASTPQSRL